MKTITKKDTKTLALSALGGTLEFYDFIIFALFTPYFTHHFFPKELDESIKLLNTYGAFAAGYLARPLGGVIMAHFGDKFGRKNMFLLSIILMVIPTFIFAIMPTYEQIGYFAIAILLAIRLVQGVAIGGELPGAWAFIYEHSPDNKKALFLGVLTSGVCGGITLGALSALLLQLNFTEDEIKDYAYRIPFLIGGIFGLISIYLRRFLQETPIFKQLQAEKQLSDFPIKSVIKDYKMEIILSMFLTIVLTACVLVFLIMMPNFMKGILNINPALNTSLQIIASIFMMIGLVVCGALADRFKASLICKIFATLLVFTSTMYFYSLYVLKDFTLTCIFYFASAFFGGIVNFTSLFMCRLYKASIRYTGIGFSYNLAYAIAGFLTPIIVVQSHGKFDIGSGYYIIFICLMAFLNSVFFDKIMKNKK
ncbi:MFS transporter [Campylobacter sp. RM12640]|uniref:MFS transporter n=1 Tax=unclassified Campylobacter TaxID=2593542 RepID=UPI00301549FF|nr:MFS transporter [Campylobacter sp. RM12640]MBZ7988394.1 MFS transporter [Campylobacter sp. RM12635]